MDDSEVSVILDFSNIPSISRDENTDPDNQFSANNLIIKMPFSHEDELMQYENIMSAGNIFYDAMLMIFKELNNNNTIVIINDIMKTIMTPTLATRFRLNGQNNKISFRETCPTILKNIFEAIRKRNPKLKIKVIEFVIDRFFEQ